MAHGRQITSGSYEGLTPKQVGFAHGVAKGDTLTKAYRDNYDADNMKDNSVHGAASDLMTDPRVNALVNHLLKEQEKVMLRDAVKIRQHVFAGLMRESDDFEDGSSMSRIKALELLGKIDIVSMFKDRTESVIKDERRPEELEAAIKARLKSLMKPV